MSSISFAIPVCNEHNEIQILFNQLLTHSHVNDEVVVQMDSERVTDEVRYVVDLYSDKFKEAGIGFESIEYPLHGDFSDFKNNLKSKCSNDYVFQIDADEFLADKLISNIHTIVDSNPDIEVYFIPRINGVIGITDEYIDSMHWSKTQMNNSYLAECGGQAINFPDFQMRLMKNIDRIFWKNKVHEVLTGFRGYAAIDFEMEDFSLIHIKTFERQRYQNEFYKSI